MENNLVRDNNLIFLKVMTKKFKKIKIDEIVAKIDYITRTRTNKWISHYFNI